MPCIHTRLRYKCQAAVALGQAAEELGECAAPRAVSFELSSRGISPAERQSRSFFQACATFQNAGKVRRLSLARWLENRRCPSHSRSRIEVLEVRDVAR